MRTVVIVDDEPVTRMDLSEMLQELGLSVMGEAADGFDAIELCRIKRPDVVLMDIRMPIFDGLTAAEAILSEELAGCVVLLTAFSDQELMERAGKAGVTGYLVKPIDQKSLLPTIEVALAQSRSLRKSRRQTEQAQRLLREDRQNHKAQRLLAQAQGCTENEAYQWMRKKAMDRRISVGAVAAQLLCQMDRPDDVATVKALLMQQKKMSENHAYRFIADYGKSHGCTVEEAARRLRAQLSGGDPDAP